MSPLDHFAREEEMTAPARQAWPAWWGPMVPDAIAEEITGQGGIADLVGCEFDQRALTERRRSRSSPILEWAPLACVSKCREGPFTSKELAEALGVSVSHTRSAIAKAVAQGALKREGTLIFPTSTWLPAATRLVAVELKLRGWRKALRQATSYDKWADEAWIVMGSSVSNELKEVCESQGIGLATLDLHHFHVLVKPVPRKPSAWHTIRLLAGEQILRQYRASKV